MWTLFLNFLSPWKFFLHYSSKFPEEKSRKFLFSSLVSWIFLNVTLFWLCHNVPFRVLSEFGPVCRRRNPTTRTSVRKTLALPLDKSWASQSVLLHVHFRRIWILKFLSRESSLSSLRFWKTKDFIVLAHLWGCLSCGFSKSYLLNFAISQVENSGSTCVEKNSSFSIDESLMLIT